MGRRRLWLSGLLVAGLLAGPAQARHRRDGTPAAAHPRSAPQDQLQREGMAALAAGELAIAGRLLGRAYRQSPSPELLYQLGLLAQAEGRLLDAHDLLARYLADPDLEVVPPLPAPVQKLVQTPPPPHARLSVIGDRGTVVAVDGRPVGVLPLPLPLLISPSEHQLTFEGRGPPDADTVQLDAGHVGEFRYSRSPLAMLLTELPAILLDDDYGLLPPPHLGALEQAVDRVLLKARLAPIPLSLGRELAADPALPTCGQAVDCQLGLARKLAADSLLRLRLTQPAGSPSCQLSLLLVDSEVGEAAASSERTVQSCTIEASSTALSEALSELLAQGLSRPRGKLELHTQPPAAELYVDGRRRGPTPYRGVLWAGEHQLRLTLDGYLPVEQPLHIPSAGTETLDIALALPPEPPPAPLIAPPPPPPPPLRPRWPLLLGGGLLGAGLVIGGFGVSGVYSGTLKFDNGSDKYSRAEPAGGVLLGLGLALSGAGALTLGLTLSRPPWKPAKPAAGQLRNPTP